MEQVWKTREQEKMAEQAAKDGGDGLWRSLKTHGMIQLVHLIGAERYDDARKIVEVLERVKSI